MYNIPIVPLSTVARIHQLSTNTFKSTSSNWLSRWSENNLNNTEQLDERGVATCDIRFFVSLLRTPAPKPCGLKSFLSRQTCETQVQLPS